MKKFQNSLMALEEHMLGEFKKFISRGNVIDLAVGVIIGGAFTKIVTSVVNDLIMPLLGLITGPVNFADRFILLGKAPEDAAIKTIEQAKEMGIATLNYGSFITNVLDFIIVAFVIFLLVKGINKLNDIKKKPASEPVAAPTTKECPFCKSTIHIDATRCPNCTSPQG